VINSQLTSQQLKQYCPLKKAERALMEQAVNRFALSARGFYRVLKIARTIADLSGLDTPGIDQYQEALSFRSIVEPNTK
jgi:magnesium chelatase family protein